MIKRICETFVHGCIFTPWNSQKVSSAQFKNDDTVDMQISKVNSCGLAQSNVPLTKQCIVLKILNCTFERQHFAGVAVEGLQPGQ